MAFNKAFLRLMPHTIMVYPATGIRDANGVMTHSPVGKSYRCRIAGKVLSLRRSFRDEQTQIFDIWADTNGDALSLEDRYVLPDDLAWQGREPEIFAVARLTDHDGHHHTKIQCGWQYHRQGQ